MRSVTARNAKIIRLRDQGTGPRETAKAISVTIGIVNKVYSDAIQARRDVETAQRTTLLSNWGRYASA